MALDDDMSSPPQEPGESTEYGTPADRAEGSMGKDQYLGRDSIADLEGDGGADGGAGSGAGADDPTTETDEDTRFA